MLLADKFISCNLYLFFFRLLALLINFYTIYKLFHLLFYSTFHYYVYVCIIKLDIEYLVIKLATIKFLLIKTYSLANIICNKFK